MNLFRTVLALIAFALAGAAHAGSTLLTCTPPTTNTDGSALTDLAGYRFYYGTAPTELTSVWQVANPATCSATFTGLAPVTWYFGVKAYNVPNVESALLNIVTKVVTEPAPQVPNPPGGLTAKALTVYVIKQTANNIALVAVGTVPATTVCDTTDGVVDNGKAYYRVPVAAVTWAGSVTSVVVVADCS